MSDLLEAAEQRQRIRSGAEVFLQGIPVPYDSTGLLADFATELLTREWLDAPTESGWWWCIAGTSRSCIEIHEGEVANYRASAPFILGPRKWCRAYVPELPS